MTLQAGDLLRIQRKGIAQKPYHNQGIFVVVVDGVCGLSVKPLAGIDEQIPVGYLDMFYYVRVTEDYRGRPFFFEPTILNFGLEAYRTEWAAIFKYYQKMKYVDGNLLCVRSKGATNTFFNDNGPFVAVVNGCNGLCVAPLLIPDAEPIPVADLDMFDHVLVNEDYRISASAFEHLIVHLGLDDYRAAWADLRTHWQDQMISQ